MIVAVVRYRKANPGDPLGNSAFSRVGTWAPLQSFDCHGKLNWSLHGR
jgi:hypothetical protein